MQTAAPTRKAPDFPLELEVRSSLMHEEYNPKVWQTSTVRAFANLLKTMVGAGVLTLPHATMTFGLLSSVIGTVVAGYLSAKAIMFAIRCNAKVQDAEGGGGDGGADDGHGGTWQRIGYAAFGRPGVVIIVIALLVAQLGVAAAYFDFVWITLERHPLVGSVPHL